MKLENLDRNFSEEAHQRNIDTLNNVLKNLDFIFNFGGNIVTLKDIPASSSFSIAHGLKRVPQQRVVLRHIGGTIVDSSTEWNDKTAYFENKSTDAISLIKILFL